MREGDSKDPEFGSFFPELAFLAVAPVIKDVAMTLLKEFLQRSADPDARNARKRIEAASPEGGEGSVAAEAGHQLTEATARVISSLEGVGEAVIQVGRLLVVKRDEEGEPVLSVFSLEKDQLEQLEWEPEILRNPVAALEYVRVSADGPQAAALIELKGDRALNRSGE